MEQYDYNQKKSSGISPEKIRKLEELMSFYGPVDENGYPEKVTKTSYSYYLREVEIRRKAIVNICDCIKNNLGEYNEEALKRERTSVLQRVSSIIEEARKKAKKTGQPFTLTEEEETIVMTYAIKKQEENYYISPDEDDESLGDEEEFFSAEELFIAYGGEGPKSLGKRLGVNIKIVK